MLVLATIRYIFSLILITISSFITAFSLMCWSWIGILGAHFNAFHALMRLPPRRPYFFLDCHFVRPVLNWVFSYMIAAFENDQKGSHNQLSWIPFVFPDVIIWLYILRLWFYLSKNSVRVTLKVVITHINSTFLVCIRRFFKLLEKILILIITDNLFKY